LDAAHLDRLVAISALVRALHDADAMNALGFERRHGLVDQAEDGNHERDALKGLVFVMSVCKGATSLFEVARNYLHISALVVP
jgi:hypothetical protein